MVQCVVQVRNNQAESTPLGNNHYGLGGDVVQGGRVQQGNVQVCRESSWSKVQERHSQGLNCVSVLT